MRRTVAIVPLFVSVLALAGDPLIPAMKEELARNMKELRLPDLGPPYYLAFYVRDDHDITIRATLGSLAGDSENRLRTGRVDLRVGSEDLDNTGFVSLDRRLRINPFLTLPVDDDPQVVRRLLWTQTDDLYKAGLQMLARKKAFLKSRVSSLLAPDFVEEKAVKIEQVSKTAVVDRDVWEERTRRLSAIMRRYPAIVESDVIFFLRERKERFVNSEGSEIVVGSGVEGIEVSARAVAKDGMELQDFSVLYGRDLARRVEDFQQEVEEMAKRLTIRLRAERGRDYLGPVLFEGQAACELFGQLFAPAVSGRKPRLYEDSRYRRGGYAPALRNHLKRRVLPRFLDVTDDPAATEAAGRQLLGGYPVDQQGVAPERVALVQKGILKGLLMMRSPHPRILHSNGHARAERGYPGGRISNLLVTTTEPRTDKKLRKQLTALLKEQDLPYGLVIRKLNDVLLERQGRGTSGDLTSPVEAFRYYRDGRVEEVRGLRFERIDIRTLRDIVAAGRERYVYNYFQSGRGGTVLSSVVAPPLLFEEMELSASDLGDERPPILESPVAEAAGDQAAGWHQD